MGTVTISGTDHTVYGTTSGLKTYMASNINSTAYDDASSKDRKKAHVSATRWFERTNWQGNRTDPDTPQDLEHPRTGLTNKDGEAVASDVIYQDVIDGCYELVNYLLDDATLTQNLSSGSNVKRVKAGSAEVEFFRGTDGVYPEFPAEVHNLVGWFLEGAGDITAPYAPGTDVESAFDDDDRYSLSEGLA